MSRLGAGTLLAAGLWPGARAAEEDGASFRFIAVNDLHYMSEDCGKWLEKVVARIRGHRDAEFCLVVGDLVETGHRSHVGAVSDILKTLGMPFYTQPGNHDYLNDQDRTGYDAVFPKGANYWFEHRGWQFVGFDSTEGTRYEGTSIQPTAMDWLVKTTPELSSTKPTVIFTHFPLGGRVNYRPKNADAALDLFRERNLRAVFNGHFHGYTLREWNHASLTTNRCCSLKRGNHDGTQEKGYFLCSVKDGILSREFIQVNT